MLIREEREREDVEGEEEKMMMEAFAVGNTCGMDF